MAEYLVQDTSLTAVADAIRAKTGGSTPLAFPSGMVSAIAGITSGSSSGDSTEGYYHRRGYVTDPDNIWMYKTDL